MADSSLLREYAELLVKKACAIQPGQELVLQASVEMADFARRVVKAAYEAGAGHVTVIWHDDVVDKLCYEHVALAWFETLPSWQKEQLNSLAEAGAAFLFLSGQNPRALEGVDAEKVKTARRARNEQADRFRRGLDYGLNVWTIAGVSVPSWAEAVFPDLDSEMATEKLWEQIFKIARVGEGKALENWDQHNASFIEHKARLNQAQYVGLHYKSANGTDLRLKLNEGHIWEGGAMHTQEGRQFFPNVPTEEVFTTPNCYGTEGIVYSALPLNHAGQLVDKFWLRFEQGRVVEYGAETGEEVLKSIIETDEGGARLGECALVSKFSPIRQSGVLFYDTLYDENAACHLALGAGFPECIEGGLEQSLDELLERGVNKSKTHVDFMIGSDDLEIYGLRADGSEEPIFLQGAWA